MSVLPCDTLGPSPMCGPKQEQCETKQSSKVKNFHKPNQNPFLSLFCQFANPVYSSTQFLNSTHQKREYYHQIIVYLEKEKKRAKKKKRCKLSSLGNQPPLISLVPMSFVTFHQSATTNFSKFSFCQLRTLLLCTQEALVSFTET